MRTVFSFTLLTVVLFAAGCAGSREAVSDHPLEGEWSYVVETDDADYEGVLSFTVVEDVLQGTITDDEGSGVSELRNLHYDATNVTFEFESDEYGLLVADLALDGDSLSGELNVTSYGMRVPMTGSRID